MSIRETGEGIIEDVISNEEFNKLIDWETTKESKKDDDFGGFNVDIDSIDFRTDQKEIKSDYIKGLERKIKRQRRKIVKTSQETNSKTQTLQNEIVNLKNLLKKTSDELQTTRTQGINTEEEIRNLSQRLSKSNLKLKNKDLELQKTENIIDSLRMTKTPNLQPVYDEIDSLKKMLKSKDNEVNDLRKSVYDLTQKNIKQINEIRELKKENKKNVAIVVHAQQQEKSLNSTKNKLKVTENELKALKRDYSILLVKKSGNVDFKDLYKQTRDKYKNLRIEHLETCARLIEMNRDELVELVGEEIDRFSKGIEEWKELIKDERPIKDINKFKKRYR